MKEETEITEILETTEDYDSETAIDTINDTRTYAKENLEGEWYEDVNRSLNCFERLVESVEWYGEHEEITEEHVGKVVYQSLCELEHLQEEGQIAVQKGAYGLEKAQEYETGSEKHTELKENGITYSNYAEALEEIKDTMAEEVVEPATMEALDKTADLRGISAIKKVEEYLTEK